MTTNESRDDPADSDQLMDYLRMDLVSKDYDRLWEIICELGLQRDLSQELKPALDQHKPGVMRSLLNTMSILSTDDIGYFVPQAISGLRSLGVDWPDLEILERSYRADMKRASARDKVDEDWSMGKPAPQEINDLFDFLEYDDEINAVASLYRLADADLDHGYAEEIAPYKQLIIRGMLRWAQGEDEWAPTVLGAIDTLRSIGLDWPELSAISKSAQSDHNRLGEAWSKTYKKSINCSNPKGFSQRAHCAARRKRQAGGKTRSKSVSETVRKLMDTDGSADKEQLKQEARTMVIDMLRRDLATNSDRGIYYAMYHMDDWNLHIRNWPELGEMIDDHKRQIVSELLRTIKGEYGHDTDGVQRLVDRMRKIGVDWSELDAIARSLNANNTQSLDESDYTYVKYTIDGVLASIEEDDPREMVLFLSNLVYADLLLSLVQEFVKQLNTHQQFIVKALLEFLKYESDDAQPDDTVRDCLLVLNQLGISSPELNIIKRSLAIHSTNPNAAQLDELTAYRSHPAYKQARATFDDTTDQWSKQTRRIDKLEQFKTFLEKNGFNFIDRGSFGAVFERPGYPWVFKIFNKDPAYLHFLKYAMAHQGNTHLPKIKGIIPINADTYAVRMERLSPIPLGTEPAMSLIRKIVNIDSYGDLSDADAAWIDKKFPGISAFFKSFPLGGFEYDLNLQNFMQRGNTMVIVDPIYDYNALHRN
jgi:hypothetical protein